MNFVSSKMKINTDYTWRREKKAGQMAVKVICQSLVIDHETNERTRPKDARLVREFKKLFFLLDFDSK